MTTRVSQGIHLPYGIIYCAYNHVTNKYYIGQTTETISRRWNRHVSDSLAHKNASYFHKAVRKHGRSAFELSTVAVADSLEQLNQLETLWIITTRSHDKHVGYNSTYGGDREEPTAETVAKLKGSAAQRRQRRYNDYEEIAHARRTPVVLSSHPEAVRSRLKRAERTSIRLSLRVCN
jgi:group I intron endonuclease